MGQSAMAFIEECVLVRPEREECRWPDGSEDQLLQLVKGSVEHEVGFTFHAMPWRYIADVLDTRRAQLLEHLEGEVAKQRILVPVIKSVKMHVLKGTHGEELGPWGWFSWVHHPRVTHQIDQDGTVTYFSVTHEDAEQMDPLVEQPPSLQALGIQAKMDELVKDLGESAYLLQFDLKYERTQEFQFNQQPANWECTAVFLALHVAPRVYLVLQLSVASADESGKCSIQAVSLAGNLVAIVQASLEYECTAWLSEELAGQVGRRSSVLQILLPDGTLMVQGPTKLIEVVCPASAIGAEGAR